MAISFIYIGGCLGDGVKVPYIVVLVVRIQCLVFSSVYAFFISLNIILRKKLLVVLGLR